MERRHQSEIQALQLSFKEKGEVLVEANAAEILVLEATIKDRNQELGHQKYCILFINIKNIV